ncbi:class A beta-lactamase [Dyella sp. 2HG41-7]|uniref:class A beta-lactamase n=1 Tax=Dyella sp. 2HG41-7 TaxID=2883239 RepID=UPI001EFF3243|nr:class A beta-lactamase [Dyella sp. 2HG41-7]
MFSKYATFACRALIFAGATWLPVSAFAANQGHASQPDAHLQHALQQLATQARPGLLGITVLDLKTGAAIRVNADRAYPMMSVFKAPVAATVLAQIDAGRLSLDQTVTINRQDVEGGSAIPSIGAHFNGEHMTFSVRRLLVAMVSESDNTAADALVRLVGGPEVVTAFLRAHGVDGMRIDLDEAGVSRIFEQTENGASISPQETDQQALMRERRGYEAYLRDPRNRTTPDAAADFLKKLWKGQMLSSGSTKRLLDLMYGQTVPVRLRRGLPATVRFADKCGTSLSLDGITAAFNDIGIITWPDGHTVVVAAFLTASHADRQQRDALFAEIASDVSQAFAK